MIGFVLLSLSLLIFVVWLIAPALLGKRKINQDDTDTQNTEIARERLSELELRLAQQEVSQQEFEEIKIEIEKSLLQDVRDGEVKKTIKPKIERNAFVIIIAIPIMSVSLYLLWGTIDSVDIKGNPMLAAQNLAASKAPNAQQPLGSVDEMAALLEAKLEKEPNNPNGWYTLGRTYMSLKNYDKAVSVFRRLNKLIANDATVLLALADALTMSKKGRMQGEPFELVKQALKLKPNDLMALWLAGIGYAESGDGKTAVTLWKQLLPLVSKEPRSVYQVESLIVAAEKKMGLQPSISVTPLPAVKTVKQAAPASIKVTVKLSAELKAKVSANDFVLIYARAATGPKMPLAIVRKQVKDLPLSITLDDSMAMQPTMKMSNFAKVDILARVSKLGQAIPQSGDKLGQVESVSVKGAKPVTVVIDTVLP